MNIIDLISLLEEIADEKGHDTEVVLQGGQDIEYLYYDIAKGKAIIEEGKTK